MSAFDKEQYDVAQIFLTYLTFLGNTTKVAIELGMQPEVIEVLAAKEDWETKLKTYLGLRHENELSRTDQAIRRSVAFIQACHLRDIIHRAIDYLYANDTKSLIDGMSPRNPKTNRPRFDAKILCDLTRALCMATRIIGRIAGETAPGDRDGGQAHRSFAGAIERATNAVDRLPGQDSVRLAKRSLAKWGQTSEQA